MIQSLRQTLASRVWTVSDRPVNKPTTMELWQDLSAAIVGRTADRWAKASNAYAEGRQKYYFSAKFPMGHALFNSLSNLDLVDEARQTLAEYDRGLSFALGEEPDAAFGNSDPGRLTACFLDSCATLDFPVAGRGILYHYDLFEQFLDKGFQTEHPSPWMERDYPFVVRREGAQRIVSYADLTVRAVLYDMSITGYDMRSTSTLHLWRVEPIEGLDCDAFNPQRFTEAVIDYKRMSDISRILYPNDTAFENEVLRVHQRHFFYSTSLQAVVDDYAEHHDEDLNDFAEYNTIQLNNTHPILIIPELMRLLMDGYGLGQGGAWRIVSNTFAYTNHTVLAEVLRKQEMMIFDRLLPRIAKIVRGIDRRSRTDMTERGLDRATIDYMAPAAGNTVCMTWIVCCTSYSINGVVALRTEIIKRETLKEQHKLWPERFNNKTNGATPRRWLKQYNPRLTALLDGVASSDAWVTSLSLLDPYLNAVNDSVLDWLARVEHENEVDFAAWAKERGGIDIDPDAIFDVQIKRLYEYKCQLLNALYVLDLYFRMKENSSLDVPECVFVFGAKAASDCIRVKGVIKLINTIVELVSNDEKTADRIKVIFIYNYNMSPVKYIIPVADASEQISTAGKEASGISNMKFMMGGTLTLDTLDGANVEILDAVGEGNAYTFGMTEDELSGLRKNHDPHWYYESIPGLKRAFDVLIDGTLDDNGPGWFRDLRWSLLESGYKPADVYYILGDFAAYCEAKGHMATDHADVRARARKTWVNVTKSGRFFSNRTIRSYAEGV